MHTVLGARVSVSRRKLSVTELPKDEEGRDAYENLQEKDKRCLSNLQTAYRALLLSRETLPRNKVSCTLLFEYQAQNEAATTSAEIATGSAAQVSHYESDGSLIFSRALRRTRKRDRLSRNSVTKFYETSIFLKCRRRKR